MEIKQLTADDIEHIPNIVSGYQTSEIYQVGYSDDEAATAVTLTLTPLDTILHKKFPALTADDLERYRAIPAAGFSFGVVTDTAVVGMALAEPHFWNGSLLVWEFHIADGYRRQGWGKLLMTKLIAQAQTAKLRTIICETQNTNVPAIRFYRRLGFRVEALDISYYSNNDLQPDKEVAVFMKRRISS